MTRVIGGALLVLTLLGTIGLWLFSHYAPERFGTCKQVPLNIGQEASIEECQAYGSTEFVVPLAVALISLLLISSADIELSIPGIGTIKRTREGKEAAQALKQETQSLDERGAKFLQNLPPSPPEGDGRH